MQGNIQVALRHNAELLTLSSDEVERIISGCRTDQKRMVEMLAALYRQLAPKVGAQPVAISHWLRTRNSHLNARPLDLLDNIEGFQATLTYLGALDSSQTS